MNNHRLMFALRLLGLLLAGLLTQLDAARKADKSKCETIKTDICNLHPGFGYNLTSFPNFFDHRTQEEALAELNAFQPLFKLNCHEHLRPFVCSLYLPVCTPGVNLHVPPCRSLCTDVEAQCAPLMQDYGFDWPFNCTKVAPPANDSGPCIKPSTEQKEARQDGSQSKSRKGLTSAQPNKQLRLTCKGDTTILIKKIRHSKSSCCSNASMAVLAAMCNGRSSCTFFNNASTLGGHCRGNVGELTVRHKCVRNAKAGACL